MKRRTPTRTTKPTSARKAGSPSKGRSSNTAAVAPNPMKVMNNLSVRFRDKRGRFCAPSKGVSYEVKVSWKRKPIKGEIPPAYRRTVKAKSDHIVDVLVAENRKVTKQDLPAKKAKLSRELKKPKLPKEKRERIKKQITRIDASLEKEAKKVERATLREKKRKPTAKDKSRAAALKDRELQILEAAGIQGIPADLPDISKLRVATTHATEKLLTGKRYEPKRPDSREGIKDYLDRRMTIQKDVFRLTKEVPVTKTRRNVVAPLMKEVFREHAQNFVRKWSGNSENAYIMRVTTREKIAGRASNESAIGTARFRLSRHVPIDVQLQQLESELEELFQYFVTCYEGYLARATIEEYAITGFTMEVVEKSE